MDDPYAPVPSGTRGTVEYVDSMGQIHMKWDNHRTLAVVPAVDTFRKLTPEEIKAEQTSQGKVDDLISQASNLERERLRECHRSNHKKFGTMWCNGQT